MKLFGTLYDKTLQWAGHRHAERYLAGLSFAESSFFPVPPDVMLAPMVLAKRHLAWRFALITTIMSVLGGLLGYVIGNGAFEVIEPILIERGYWDSFQKATDWFGEWGIWVILLAGFTPIPFKVFTIAAGVVGMAIVPFVLMSIIGRGARFFLVAGLMFWGGEKMERMLRKSIESVGWALVALALIAYFLIKH
ncbi:MAG: DedA family protein [Gammaproteobacteria bacterium]|nr:DedA family protein [Gammaproteobacteria bacterium]